MPERIQLRRTKGWRIPEGAIVVSRPSKWGNPITFSDVGAQYPSLNDLQLATMVVRTFEPLARTGSLFLPNWRFLGGRRGPLDLTYPSVDEIRRELAGRDLACWCPLLDADGRHVPCHADLLLELANEGTS